LRENRFQAAFDESAAIVGHYRDGYDIIVRHEQEPENLRTRVLRIATTR